MYVYVLYTVFWCEFNGDIHFVIRLTIFGNFFVYMYVYMLCTIFWCEFNGGIHIVIRLTIFGNFFVLYVCICVIHRFLVRIQSWRWLCHPEIIFRSYMIWSSPSIIFQWEFSCDGDSVICRLYFDNIWYGHHQTSFFGENSVMMVTMSSADYILIIYDMVIT